MNQAIEVTQKTRTVTVDMTGYLSVIDSLRVNAAIPALAGNLFHGTIKETIPVYVIPIETHDKVMLETQGVLFEYQGEQFVVMGEATKLTDVTPESLTIEQLVKKAFA